jgi:hypothetical protein
MTPGERGACTHHGRALAASDVAGDVRTSAHELRAASDLVKGGRRPHPERHCGEGRNPGHGGNVTAWRHASTGTQADRCMGPVPRRRGAATARDDASGGRGISPRTSCGKRPRKICSAPTRTYGKCRRVERHGDLPRTSLRKRRVVGAARHPSPQRSLQRTMHMEVPSAPPPRTSLRRRPQPRTRWERDNTGTCIHRHTGGQVHGSRATSPRSGDCTG